MVFKTDYSLMQVKKHSAILKLLFVIKVFVLSIFEWPLKTGFTVYASSVPNMNHLHQKIQEKFQFYDCQIDIIKVKQLK